ncbi:hypothetical protein ADL29_35990 [Streptomyces chattanoogensis]|uniref:Uncharacterized protein n=1 Tax=Streptomyces chattanoogensis TaxID=66876 RepID=A0A0N0XSP0_9ACTN|nr:hypothetical protein ADL29_35990 [Streptomyces chattanoogensis]
MAITLLSDTREAYPCDRSLGDEQGNMASFPVITPETWRVHHRNTEGRLGGGDDAERHRHSHHSRHNRHNRRGRYARRRAPSPLPYPPHPCHRRSRLCAGRGDRGARCAHPCVPGRRGTQVRRQRPGGLLRP